MVLHAASPWRSLSGVMQPLAVVAYKKLMPGSQVVNRLQDLGYRVQTVSDLMQLPDLAATGGLMLVIIDLDFEGDDVCGVISKLRKETTTAHVPIIAFLTEGSVVEAESVRAAGATLVANAAGIQHQLPDLLEAVLRVE